MKISAFADIPRRSRMAQAVGDSLGECQGSFQSIREFSRGERFTPVVREGQEFPEIRGDDE